MQTFSVDFPLPDAIGVHVCLTDDCKSNQTMDSSGPYHGKGGLLQWRLNYSPTHVEEMN